MPGENVGSNDSPYLGYLPHCKRGIAASPASGMKRTAWKTKTELITCIA